MTTGVKSYISGYSGLITDHINDDDNSFIDVYVPGLSDVPDSASLWAMKVESLSANLTRF